jgi:hypothetical protein
MMKERWESVCRVRRDSALGDGVAAGEVGEEWDGDGGKKDGGTNTVVESTDSAIIVVVNNNVLSTVHICVVSSLDPNSTTLISPLPQI